MVTNRELQTAQIQFTDDASNLDLDTSWSNMMLSCCVFLEGIQNHPPFSLELVFPRLSAILGTPPVLDTKLRERLSLAISRLSSASSYVNVRRAPVISVDAGLVTDGGQEERVPLEAFFGCRCG